MTDRTNVDVAAAAIDTASRFIASDGYPALRVLAHEEYARVGFDAIDPRLADLTPEDVTAIFDYVIARHRFETKTLTSTAVRSMDAWHVIPAHAWEVLSR